MMKFRIFDLKKEEYIKGNSKFFLSQIGTLHHLYSEIDEGDFVVQFSTGIKDERGIEVYEGDILTIQNGDKSNDYEVVYRRGAFRLNEIKHSQLRKAMPIGEYSKFKIVDNVFKKPWNPYFNS